LINIRVEDIDFINNMVYIKTTKDRKPLIIPLSETIISILKEYINIRKRENEDYLFCNAYGQQLNRNAISDNLRSYNRRRGVTTTGIHRFRHTFAKNWILNGGDIFRLQKILGHSDMEVVRNYVNMFTNDLQKDFNEFNPLENILKKRDYRKSIKMR
jgi:integrase/recombinase XerD